MINHKSILQYLADGIHPFPGEIFEDNHICQNSKVTRALLEAVKLLEEQESKKSNQLLHEYKNIKRMNISDLPIEANIDIKCEIIYLTARYTILKYLNQIYKVRTTKVETPTTCGFYIIKKVLYGKEQEYCKLQYRLMEN